jgi:V/A-type H+/Na+-transporting ATPase subunit B
MTPDLATPSAREYLSLKSISGPLLVLEGVKNVGYDESVEIILEDGSRKMGRVIAAGRDETVVELFGDTLGPGCFRSPKTS